MRYLLYKAWKRFRANLRSYLFLIIQISVGVCMIAVSLNISFSFEEQFSAFRQSVNNRYISIQPGDVYGNSSDTLSVRDYREIQTEFEAEKDLLSYYKDYSLSNSDGSYGVPVLFVDENFYTLLMKAANHREGGVYLGSRARQYLSDFMATPSDFMDTKNQTVFGVPISSFVPLEKLDYQSKALLEDGFLSGVFGETDFEDYIIFPLSVYEGLAAQPDCRSSLAVATGQNQAEQLARDVLVFLEQRHEGEEYQVYNYGTMAEDHLNRNRNIAGLLNALSAFVLIIVVFGFLGLLFILVSRRNREFAVALMCGASKRQILLEVFFEVLIGVLIGVCAGNLAGIPFLPLLGNAASPASYHMKTLLYTLLGGIAVSALVCLPPLRKMRRISPISILKNL